MRLCAGFQEKEINSPGTSLKPQGRSRGRILPRTYKSRKIRSGSNLSTVSFMSSALATLSVKGKKKARIIAFAGPLCIE